MTAPNQSTPPGAPQVPTPLAQQPATLQVPSVQVAPKQTGTIAERLALQREKAIANKQKPPAEVYNGPLKPIPSPFNWHELYAGIPIGTGATSEELIPSAIQALLELWTAAGGPPTSPDPYIKHVVLRFEKDLDASKEVIKPALEGFAAEENQRIAEHSLTTTGTLLHFPAVTPSTSTASDKEAKKKKNGPANPLSVPAGFPRTVDEMLCNYVCILGSKDVYDRRTKCVIQEKTLVLAHPDLYPEWMYSPDRTRIDRADLVFKPDGAAPGQVNLFDGFPDIPADDGSADPWFEHILMLCGGNKEHAHWVVTRFAYKLQHPGTKVESSIVFHGAQGTGKSQAFDPLIKIYGRFGATIGQPQLDSRFNTYLSQKLLLVGDEVIARGPRDKNIGILKGLITEGRVVIDDKNVSLRWEDNFVDLHFLSNDDIPIIAEVGDRRYFVMKCDTVMDKAYFRRLAAISVYDLKRRLLAWDCGDFNAHSEPPSTASKRELIDLSKDSPLRFLDAWLSGETPLPIGSATSSDLYHAYRVWAKSNGENAQYCTHMKFAKKLNGRLWSAVKYVPSGYTDESNNFKSTAGSARVWTVADKNHDVNEALAFRGAISGWVISLHNRLL